MLEANNIKSLGLCVSNARGRFLKLGRTQHPWIGSGAPKPPGRHQSCCHPSAYCRYHAARCFPDLQSKSQDFCQSWPRRLSVCGETALAAGLITTLNFHLEFKKAALAADFFREVSDSVQEHLSESGNDNVKKREPTDSTDFENLLISRPQARST